MSTFLRNKTISKTTPLREENPFPRFNVASHKRPGIRLSFEYTTTLLSGKGEREEPVQLWFLEKFCPSIQFSQQFCPRLWVWFSLRKQPTFHDTTSFCGVTSGGVVKYGLFSQAEVDSTLFPLKIWSPNSNNSWIRAGKQRKLRINLG